MEIKNLDGFQHLDHFLTMCIIVKSLSEYNSLIRQQGVLPNTSFKREFPKTMLP